MPLLRYFAVPSIVVAFAVAPAHQAQSSANLAVVGEDGTSRTFSTVDLAALPQIEVRIREADSSTVIFRGPTLREVMTRVGAPAGRALRGPAMTLGVLAEAADNYRVGYMLAEIDEQFGAKSVIVAITQNGQPLPPRDGPFRIVVAGEEHRARWIRQLTTLRLVRLGKGS